LRKRQSDDELKRDLCEKHGITLIVIPILFKKVKVNELKTFLIEKFREQKVPFPSDAEALKIDLRNAYAPEMLFELRKTAKERGGALLSKAYLGKNYKLEWECSHRHRWLASPYSILGRANRNPSWCRLCGYKKSGLKRRVPLRELRRIARVRGGKCLTKKFVSSERKILWECKRGHRWYATVANVKHNKSWCMECSGKRKWLMEEIQAVVAARGGRCLNEKYLGLGKKHHWECSKGHTWEATALNVIHNRSWCPECYEKRRSAKR
jgi:hypothetical protein